MRKDTIYLSLKLLNRSHFDPVSHVSQRRPQFATLGMIRGDDPDIVVR